MPKKQKRRSYRHLTQADRDRIEALLKCGTKQKDIAAILKIDPSTIGREKKRRRKDGRYDATVAEHKAQVRRLGSKYQGMKVEKSPELRAHIIANLKEKRSPDEIAGRMKREKKAFYCSKNAIYKWLYSVYGQPYCHYLCTRRRWRRPQKKKTHREMIPNRVSIEKLPLGAKNKTRYGHFETDTVVAPKRVDNNEAISLSSEKKTKLIMGTKILSLSSREMTKSMNYLEKLVFMKTTTLDNGIENRGHESWDVPTYFADPHAPWQKPLIEGSIGLLRRWFFKKGTDWAMISEEELQEALLMLNNKYRKSLGYQSAIEVATAHGIIKK